MVLLGKDMMDIFREYSILYYYIWNEFVTKWQSHAGESNNETGKEEDALGLNLQNPLPG